MDEKQKLHIQVLEQFSSRRSFFYTVSFAGGLVILLALRDSSVSWYTYWLFVAVVFAVMAIEFVTTFYYAKRKSKLFDLSYIPDNTIRPNTYYHIILPSLLLLSFSAYLYLNFNRIVDFVLIIVFSVVYYGFLRHIRATYENDFKTEKWSLGVMDASSIVVFFSVATAVSELALRNAWSVALITLLISSMFGFLIVLTLWKRQEIGLGPVFAACVITAIVTIITYVSWKFLGISVLPLRAGFFFALVYYIFTAVLVHKLEGSLTIGVITEYILISIVSALLLSQV